MFVRCTPALLDENKLIDTDVSVALAMLVDLLGRAYAASAWITFNGINRWDKFIPETGDSRRMVTK